MKRRIVDFDNIGATRTQVTIQVIQQYLYGGL